MLNLNHHSLRLPLIAAIVAIAASAASPAFAQDEDEVDEAAAQPDFVFADENFDQWVFGGRGNTGPARSRLESFLQLQIADVDRVCELTEAQKQKLQLAGKGDIVRFFDRVEELRRKFQKVKNDRNKIGELYQEILPLRLTLDSGAFGDDSFFAKTLKSTLSADQTESHGRADLERRLFTFRARVEWVVGKLDDALSMRADQRTRFIELILEDARPPRKFGQYDVYFVMWQAAQIPEVRLKPIFDEPPWRLLKRLLAKARGFEPFLKTNGVLSDDAGGAGAKPAKRKAAPAGVLRPAAAAQGDR